MRLESLKYTCQPDTDREWKLGELLLQDINLVVGENAAGKSRTLNAIGELAWLISGKLKLGNGATRSARWEAVFREDQSTYKYSLQSIDGKVISEKFMAGDDVRLDRRDGGAGKIYSEKESTDVEFQTPEGDLAIVSRRDTIQHKFFEPLHTWASLVYRYFFGTSLGRDTLAVEVKESAPVDIRNQMVVVPIFAMGLSEFGQTFVSRIIADMGKLNYRLDDINLVGVSDIPANAFPGVPKCLSIKETSLRSPTIQSDISQGMFRTLSILIQVNFSQLKQRPACIIIDDIGEGLDFNRSCGLIELLMSKARQGNIQLIMSTNDRFVMNKVPLEAWTVLQRQNGNTSVFNARNSQDIFDDFRYTGLNNFDFFATDFIGESQKQNGGEANEGKETSGLR